MDRYPGEKLLSYSAPLFHSKNIHSLNTRIQMCPCAKYGLLQDF